MIRLDKICSGIGNIDILHDIDLTVMPGELVVVLGANGAGKTTLLRTISGLVEVRGGTIEFDGKTIQSTKAHELARSGLVHVPQGRQIIPTLTVEENLAIGAEHLPGLGRGEIARRIETEYQRFPVLQIRRQILGGSLSGGEQQMLAVSRGLMMAPKLLMLDEPSLGLAPQALQRILAALGELAKSGMAVLMVEQKTSALQIAERAYVLKNGVIVHHAPAADLRNDADVFRHYMN
jgi:branched-chain amino acid transport system ATP-binding protein